MERKIVKIVVIILSIVILCNTYLLGNSKVLAMSDVTRTPDIWLTGEDVGEVTLSNKIEPFLSLIRTVGIIVSVISLAVIAMKIIFASVNEKAAYKQMLLPWAIGGVLVFAMTTIPTFIYNLVGEENMQGQELNVLNEPVEKAKYCPVHKEEVSGGMCMKDDCPMLQKPLENGYKCPSCSARVWEFRGNWSCPKCGNQYKK